MLDSLQRRLAQVDVDYADLRYEIIEESECSFQGAELKQVSSGTRDGFVLRVLHRGGFATVAFARLTDFDRAFKRALGNAELMGAARPSPRRMAAAPVVVEEVMPTLREDPRQISLAEKIALVKHYNDLAMQHQKVASTRMRYWDFTRNRYFVNTEGTRISEPISHARVGGSIVAAEGLLTQSAGFSIGSGQGFADLRGLDERLLFRQKVAVDLLSAEPVRAGTFDCILDPSMTGLFTHEAFGHRSEGDTVEAQPSLRERLQLGVRLGAEILNIVDDATRPNQIANCRYDDEGVAVRRTEIVRNGVLTGRLHSRVTAAEFGEPLSGHAVAEDFRYAPIVRMGCIFIEPGETSREELFAQLGDGLYVLDNNGGQTSGQQFTFGAQQGFVIRGGKAVRMVRDINISGNLFATLRNIAAVGNDFELSKVGGCGKGQLNPRSCYGGPHMLVRSVVVGGV